MEDILTMLIRHEGEKLQMYYDTRNIPTIGVGHNLRDKPISKRASRIILEDDIADVNKDLTANLPWITDLDPVRQQILQDMCFNLGIVKLLGFRNTLEMIKARNYAGAAENMLASKWASQVGIRADELAKLMEKGA